MLIVEDNPGYVDLVDESLRAEVLGLMDMREAFLREGDTDGRPQRFAPGLQLLIAAASPDT